MAVRFGYCLPLMLSEPPFSALAICLPLALAMATVAWRPSWVVDRPRLVLATLAALSLSAASMLVRLDPPAFTIDIDPASEPLIGRDDPNLPVYRKAVADFGSDDVYVVAMHTEEGVFSRDNLETVKQVTQEKKSRACPPTPLTSRQNPSRILPISKSYTSSIPASRRQVSAKSRRLKRDWSAIARSSAKPASVSFATISPSCSSWPKTLRKP